MVEVSRWIKHFVDMKFVCPEGTDCFDPVKSFAASQIFGRKVTTSLVFPRRTKEEIIAIRVAVNAEDEKRILIDANDTEISCDKETLKVLSNGGSRFKGKMYIPQLLFWKVDKFVKMIASKLPNFVRTDLDIFRSKQDIDPKTDESTPTGTVTILFKDGKKVEQFSLDFDEKTSNDYVYEVQEFEQEPLRCFRCLMFHHMTTVCLRDNDACRDYGEDSHDGACLSRKNVSTAAAPTMDPRIKSA